jgi:signal transduction histidine kinase
VRIRSLRFRLLAAAAVSVSLALIAAAFGLIILFEHHVERRLDQELETDLRQLIARIEIDADGRIHIGSELSDPRFKEPLSGWYWQIQDDIRLTLLRSRSLWDSKLDLPKDQLDLGVVHRHVFVGPVDQSLMVREQQVIMHPQTEARRLRVAVAMDRSELLVARQAFSADMLPYLALLALTLMGATWVQVRMGLSPLNHVRQGVLAISSGDAQRLPDEFPDEVMPLVDEINELLGARDDAVERARAWTADLAHGLKTPLTALGADAQQLRNTGHAEMADNLDQLAQAMRQRVDRELIRARLRTAGALVPMHTDMVAVVNGVIATLVRTPLGSRLDWHADLPEALEVDMARDDLTELLGNLMDNASKWAHDQVRISIAHDDGTRIIIEDDGPGVPYSELTNLVKRGVRLDEQTAGSGLGLAITRDILDAYGGQLSFLRSKLGGLAVSVQLKGGGRLSGP